MATVLMLTPRDHGRPMSREEFESAQTVEGYRYELIDGKLCVSPVPGPSHECLVQWVGDLLRDYRKAHPDVINFVSMRSGVLVPDRPGATVPEPDVAAYRDFPTLSAAPERWDDLNPILVVEVISEDTADKDLVRNVELYEQVQSIREYWIFDPRTNPSAPSLRVYRRRGRSWQRPIDVPPGGTYTTRLLPGFTLRVDPMG